jgi:paraquat-inducible protein B
MRKNLHPRLIGLFVVIGLIIAFLLVIFTSSGAQFFSRKHYFVLYFNDTMNGLAIGAPVKFRGVTIGSVSDVLVEVKTERVDTSITVPVIIELTASKLKLIGGQERSEEAFVDFLVKKGLRARLNTQSLISGALYIDLSFHPKTPIRLVKGSMNYYQIPTLPSSSGRLSRTLQSGQAVFESLQKLLASGKIEQALDVFVRALTNGETVMTNIGGQVIPATRSAKEAFDHFNQLFQRDQVEQALGHFNDAMLNSKAFFKNFNQQLTPATDKFDTAMTSFSDAMYSFNALTNYLSRHPEAVIQGKAPMRGNKS